MTQQRDSSVSTYKFIRGHEVIEEYKDDLTDTQKAILRLLDIPQTQFWRPKRRRL